MACWIVEFDDKADKSLDKLGHESKKMIQDYLNNRLLSLDNPRTVGKPLTGNLKGLWRYRINKFRIICDIQDDKLVILVIKIGKREDVYED